MVLDQGANWLSRPFDKLHEEVSNQLMAIRQITHHDLVKITNVFLEAYQGWTEDVARRYLMKFYNFEPESCLVALDENDQPVGAILGYSYQREKSLVLFIQELFVAPGARNKGYAKALVTALRKSFAENPLVKVKPLVDAPTQVLNFYNSLGFEQEMSFTLQDG